MENEKEEDKEEVKEKEEKEEKGGGGEGGERGGGGGEGVEEKDWAGCFQTLNQALDQVGPADVLGGASLTYDEEVVMTMFQPCKMVDLIMTVVSLTVLPQAGAGRQLEKLSRVVRHVPVTSSPCDSS